jgi:hypothetical protein
VVAAAAGLVVLAVVVAAGDGIRGLATPPAATLRLYRTLGLSEPGLTPAGRREGHPARYPAAIDWRYLPSLPQQDPGLIRPLEKERLIRATVPPP